MVWFLVSQIFSTLISLIQIGRMTDTDKDFEIMILRYQLGIAERKMLVVLATLVIQPCFGGVGGLFWVGSR